MLTGSKMASLVQRWTAAADTADIDEEKQADDQVLRAHPAISVLVLRAHPAISVMVLRAHPATYVLVLRAHPAISVLVTPCSSMYLMCTSSHGSHHASASRKNLKSLKVRTTRISCGWGTCLAVNFI